MTTDRMKGTAAEAYVWMRLLEHGMVPYLPMLDAEGADAVVRTAGGRHVRVQVKSRGRPLPDTGSYGEQVKGLWWEPRTLAFDYLVIVLPLDTVGGYEAWVVPAKVVRDKLGEGRGDITLSRRLLRGVWAAYHEKWSLD